jgi:hypothetical protein
VLDALPEIPTDLSARCARALRRRSLAAAWWYIFVKCIKSRVRSKTEPVARKSATRGCPSGERKRVIPDPCLHRFCRAAARTSPAGEPA